MADYYEWGVFRYVEYSEECEEGFRLAKVEEIQNLEGVDVLASAEVHKKDRCHLDGGRIGGLCFNYEVKATTEEEESFSSEFGDINGALSTGGGKETKIRFISRHPDPVDVYWLDYEGELKKYFTLESEGDQHIQGTYVNHPWIFKDSSSEQLLLVNKKVVFWPEETEEDYIDAYIQSPLLEVGPLDAMIVKMVPKYQVLSIDEEIPMGFDLARVCDVKYDLDVLKEAFTSAMEWHICRLADGASVSGPGYDYAIFENDDRDLGANVVVQYF